MSFTGRVFGGNRTIYSRVSSENKAAVCPASHTTRSCFHTRWSSHRDKSYCLQGSRIIAWTSEGQQSSEVYSYYISICFTSLCQVSLDIFWRHAKRMSANCISELADQSCTRFLNQIFCVPQASNTSQRMRSHFKHVLRPSISIVYCLSWRAEFGYDTIMWVKTLTLLHLLLTWRMTILLRSTTLLRIGCD